MFGTKHFGVVLLLALGLAAAALPAGAVPTCLGQELTQAVGDLFGTPGDDVILGTAAGETIYGLGGKDLICGGGGDDRLNGGAGNDTLGGGDGDDALYGQAGCDFLKGGPGNDLLYPGRPPGSACAGSLEGQGGRDRFIINDAGRNDIFGGLGKDTLDFHHFPLAILVTLNSSPPTYDFIDVLTTNSVIYDVEVIIGSQTGDMLYGGEADDDLRGFSGNDYLNGGNGDDRLIGGDGYDTVDGFNGTDTCEGESLLLCEL